MKTLRQGLQSVLSLFRHNADKPSGIPDCIIQSLQSGDTQQVKDWLQNQLHANPYSVDLNLLRAIARENGLNDKDREKLYIFGLYYKGELQATLQSANKYIEDADFDPDLFIIAVFSLYHLGQFEDAYHTLIQGRTHSSLLETRSDYAIVAALVSQAANKIDDLKRHIDMAWELAPEDPVVALNAYAINFELGDLDAFNNIREKFDAGDYLLDQTGFALATVALAENNYEIGLRLYEQRYLLSESHRYFNTGIAMSPRWQGGSLAGLSLLISAEQGLGDTIQMARYLTELGQFGAKSLIMETQPEILSLLTHNFPEVIIVAREYGRTPKYHFDCWIGAMSLPAMLGTRADTVPKRSGYLNIPTDSANYWHARVNELSTDHRPRIGIAWSGQPTHRADRRRSIPFPLISSAIRNINASFFALQKHVPEIHPANLIDVSDELVTMADTAALINELDLVISVDTSVVHVSGAIGKDTWLLLPYRYEWRWGLQGESNNWYDSVKVLRQISHGDWPNLLESTFANRLQKWTSDRKASP